MEAAMGGAPASGDAGTSAPSTSSGTPSSSGSAHGSTSIDPQGGSDLDGQPSTDAGGKPKPQTAAQKLKVKRGGKEAEYTAEELAKMVSDDWEHEWTGPGGKPVKTKYSELVRLAQKGSGALQKMQEAAKIKAEYEQMQEWGKKNVEEFLETRLGIEDVDKWAITRAKNARDFENKIARLMQQTFVAEDGKVYRNPEFNPTEASRLMAERLQQKTERKTAYEKAQQEAQQRAEQQRSGQERERQVLTNALSEHKVPANEFTLQIARRIVREHREADADLSAQELAQLTREQWNGMIHKYMDTQDDDGLASFLGDSRRERLRALDLKLAKEQRKETRQEQREEAVQQQAKPKLLDKTDWNKKYGGGGL